MTTPKPFFTNPEGGLPLPPKAASAPSRERHAFGDVVIEVELAYGEEPVWCVARRVDAGGSWEYELRAIRAPEQTLYDPVFDDVAGTVTLRAAAQGHTGHADSMDDTIVLRAVDGVVLERR